MNIDFNIEELIKQVDIDAANMSYSKKTYQKTQLPVTDRLCVAKSQLRARQYKQKHIDPRQSKLKAMEALDCKIYLWRETGAPKAEAVHQKHEANKWAIKKELKVHWSEFHLRKDSPLGHGINRGEMSRCFGWICGQLEEMPGVTRDKETRRLDFDSITVEHMEAVVDLLEKELEGERSDDDCLEYTAKIDGMDDLLVDRVIGDNSEPDFDSLLAEEYAKIDALAAKSNKSSSIQWKNL